MATERTAFRDLAVAAKAGDQPDDGETTRRLRVPTLEERALIFLRATKGREDFTNDEHAAAREIILGAMASEIASRAHPSASEGAGLASPWLERQPHFLLEPEGGPNDDAVDVEVALSSPPARMLRPMVELAGSFESRPRAVAAEPLSEDTMFVAASAHEDNLHKMAERLSRWEAANPRAQRRSKLRTLLLVLLIAVVAGLSVLGAVTLVRMTADWLRPAKPVTETSSSTTRALTGR
jgi:hypothetical protein